MSYRARIVPLLLAVLAACLMFAGCSPQGKTAEEPAGMVWDVTDAEPEFLTQWPENTFTEKIVPPQSGSIDYVLDGTQAGRYAVFIKDISAQASDKYVETLKTLGYAEIQSAKNRVSVGMILERNDALLSVSYADGVLGVLITLKDSQQFDPA